MALSRGVKGFVWILVVGILIGGAFFLRQKYGVGRIAEKVLGVYEPTIFYAVFLSNDQVYFGHIEEASSDQLLLTHVYYLKANTEIAQQPADATNQEAAATAKLSLVKLGDEMHSPQDHMVITKSQVLFIEEMKGAGVIRDAIAQDEARRP